MCGGVCVCEERGVCVCVCVCVCEERGVVCVCVCVCERRVVRQPGKHI